jgi:hypothetical protein
MGKLLIVVGLICIIAGVLITYAGRIPFLGKLPGDISVEKGNFRFYFPIATSIVLSLLVSLILYLIQRFR